MVSEVILGFPAADRAGPSNNFCDVTQSWLGGTAVWAGAKTDDLEAKIKCLVRCKLCSGGMSLVLQLYCPCDSTSDRVLYIFVCTNKRPSKSVGELQKKPVVSSGSRCASSALGWRAIRRVTPRDIKVGYSVVFPSHSETIAGFPEGCKDMISVNKSVDRFSETSDGILGSSGSNAGIDWAGILCDAQNADISIQQQTQSNKTVDNNINGFTLNTADEAVLEGSASTTRFSSIWLEAATEDHNIKNPRVNRKLDSAAAAALVRYTELHGCIDSVAENDDRPPSGEPQEKYERIGTIDDVTFEKFHKVFTANPYQVVRHCFGGEALWLYHRKHPGAQCSPSFAVGGAVHDTRTCAPYQDSTAVTDLGRNGTMTHVACGHCSAPRVFELQLMPSVFIDLLKKHENDQQQRSTEWSACKDFMLWWSGVVVVYTCRYDCCTVAEGTEELVDVQLGV
eukprot:Lankesteria_metandrocarpae@DN607_c0_g1_i2.p1